MLYVDTSVVIAALTEEAATARVRAWFDQQPNESLSLSHWVLTEVSGALSLKVRTGALPLSQRTEVLSTRRAMENGLFSRIPIRSSAFEAATRMVERHDLNLRSPDALHIAIAQAADCELVTLDKTMAKAAQDLGVSVAMI